MQLIFLFFIIIVVGWDDEAAEQQHSPPLFIKGRPPLQRWARHVERGKVNYFPINPQYKDCQGNKTYHIIKLNRVGTFNLNIKSVAQIS